MLYFDPNRSVNSHSTSPHFSHCSILIRDVHLLLLVTRAISDSDSPSPVETPAAPPEPQPQPVPKCRWCVYIICVCETQVCRASTPATSLQLPPTHLPPHQHPLPEVCKIPMDHFIAFIFKAPQIAVISNDRQNDHTLDQHHILHLHLLHLNFEI